MSYLDTLPELKVERALERARSQAFRAPGGRDMLETAGGDERYALWLLIADAGCARRIGVGIFDLADHTWADAYENGDSPSTAVLDAIANDDTFSALLRIGE